MKKYYFLLSLALAVAVPAFANLPSSNAESQNFQVEKVQPAKHKLRWHERLLLGMAERKIQRKLDKMNRTMPSNSCDTMVMSDGKSILIKLIKTDDSLVHFTLCNYEQGAVQTAPWTIVKHIRRANGQTVDRNTPMTEPVQESDLMKEAKTVRLLGLLSIPLVLLFGLGVVLGIVTLVKGSRLLKKAKGKPDEKEIRKVAKVGIIAAIIAIVLGLGILTLAIVFAN